MREVACVVRDQPCCGVPGDVHDSKHESQEGRNSSVRRVHEPADERCLLKFKHVVGSDQLATPVQEYLDRVFVVLVGRWRCVRGLARVGLAQVSKVRDRDREVACWLSSSSMLLSLSDSIRYLALKYARSSKQTNFVRAFVFNS